MQVVISIEEGCSGKKKKSRKQLQHSSTLRIYSDKRQHIKYLQKGGTMPPSQSTLQSVGIRPYNWSKVWHVSVVSRMNWKYWLIALESWQHWNEFTTLADGPEFWQHFLMAPKIWQRLNELYWENPTILNEQSAWTTRLKHLTRRSTTRWC